MEGRSGCGEMCRLSCGGGLGPSCRVTLWAAISAQAPVEDLCGVYLCGVCLPAF